MYLVRNHSMPCYVHPPLWCIWSWIMLYHVIYIRYRVTDLKVSHRCMWSWIVVCGVMYTPHPDTDLKVGGLAPRQTHEDVDVAGHEGLGEVHGLLPVSVDAEWRHRHCRVLQHAGSTCVSVCIAMSYVSLKTNSRTACTRRVSSIASLKTAMKAELFLLYCHELWYIVTIVLCSTGLYCIVSSLAVVYCNHCTALFCVVLCWLELWCITSYCNVVSWTILSWAVLNLYRNV